MHQHRLFKVAPDAIHVRLTYDPLGGTWSLHLAVVERQADGDLLSRPAETYNYLSEQEALDVVCAGLSTLLDVPPGDPTLS